MPSSLEKIKDSLQHKITSQIKQKGAISFAEFMQMALYEPGLGYYSAGLFKFGASGDFITSSELGSLFAQCHAHCFAEVIKQLDHPVILELGAGSGVFCADVLQALEQLDCLPETYWIMEVSADLQQVQQQRIEQLSPSLAQRVQWLEQPPTVGFEGIIYANEVLDALPVEVFKKINDQYMRLMLEDVDGHLSESWQEFPEALRLQLEQKELELAQEYRSEFTPNIEAWFQSITSSFEKGVVLMVDYGYGRNTYYHPQRLNGTLVCHKRHQANFNPYQDVGLQDITAFVDFTSVAEAMEGVGLAVGGFTTQADFLMGNGIDQLLNPDGDYEAYYKKATELKKLVMPDEMGEKFMVIMASKDLSAEIPGFQNNQWQKL